MKGFFLKMWYRITGKTGYTMCKTAKPLQQRVIPPDGDVRAMLLAQQAIARQEGRDLKISDPCAYCNGVGKVTEFLQGAKLLYDQRITKTCPFCKGSGCRPTFGGNQNV